MKIGDKVVCVDDSPSECPCCKGIPSGLIRNNVYVISGFSQTDGVFLIGITVPHKLEINKIKYGYLKTRFRLLDELKQQVAMKKAGIKFL